ncbi:aspartyl protease family protein [Sphingomonas jaspsi]|uniref:aspartyl protease family protein n=1 Tax=Sphingomonas jaspsi TaxID=392409 RepID=UPI00055B9A8C|nr:aspartyl protease family protein [Sphingomonas jaspsi]
MILLPFLSVLAAAATPAPVAVPQTANDADALSRTDEVAIRRDDRDRMTVAVTVSGSGPYRFLVDTGAERTVISRQLAARLKLDSGEQTVLHSVMGPNRVQTVFIPDLKVSSESMSVVDAPALEAANIGADGMLGIDSLRSQRVTFDFKAKTMAITSALERQGREDGDVVVVRAKSRKGRLIFTDAVVDGVKVNVVVDTGSQVTIGNQSLEEALVKRRHLPLTEPIEVESVTGERMGAHVATLQRVEVGGIHIDGLAIAFADAHIFHQLKLADEPTILLGMNAMRAFDRITIDFAARKVRFKLPGTSMRDGYRLALLSR